MADMQQRLLQAVKSIIPPLSSAKHKGQAGRIGVIGGSLEYTGAPYFAAITAMRAGADLSHVFCPEEAALVLKSYSPELIVHPLLSTKDTESAVVESISQWLPRLNSLVIGPGLGRDPTQLAKVKLVIEEAKKRLMDIVIDADGLFLVTQFPECVTGYKKIILTPNPIEFQRLYFKIFGQNPLAGDDHLEQTKELAARMGNLTILRKGLVDIISNGENVLQCVETGSPRRCGGQGDLLSGVTALFLFWARQSEERLAKDYSLPPTMVASYSGTYLVKKCAEIAFAKHHRSMLAGDMVNEVPHVFQTFFEP